MDNKISTKNYIVYLLNKLPAKVDFYKINKIAFLIEFAYIYKFGKVLSDTKYAAIEKGPVIDKYRNILTELEQQGKLRIENKYFVRVLEDPDEEPSEEVKSFIDLMIEKYSNFSSYELIAITHSLDSYIITSKNETSFGSIIDKDLAYLDTYFSDRVDLVDEEVPVSEDNLPILSEADLVDYEMGWFLWNQDYCRFK